MVSLHVASEFLPQFSGERFSASSLGLIASDVKLLRCCTEISAMYIQAF